jgi:hypothetical protein
MQDEVRQNNTYNKKDHYCNIILHGQAMNRVYEYRQQYGYKPVQANQTNNMIVPQKARKYKQI